MDTQKMLTDLREIIGNAYEWSFSLYSVKKSRDGMEFIAGKCEMPDVAGLVNDTIVNLLEKVLPQRTVTEYSPFLQKEAIAVFEQTNEMVREQIHDIITEVNNALTYPVEDYASGAAFNPTGYIISGTLKDEEGKIIDQAILMKRSNPFIKNSKSRLCISEGGKIVESEQPLLKFSQSADLIVTGGACYILSPAIEKDLSLENRHIAICAKCMGTIAECNLINNYETLEKEAYASKNTRKFIDFDREILDHIMRLPVLERADFLSEYGITIDQQGLIDTNDSEQCELLIDLLCCRSCHDALGRLSVGSNILPR
jgi:hypothetical protein